jgi:hypothetical protein
MKSQGKLGVHPIFLGSVCAKFHYSLMGKKPIMLSFYGQNNPENDGKTKKQHIVSAAFFGW